ncbi:multicopper oxidase family protein [Salarchaeum sp. JOR-1]|uniref:multicopper oxidase family protein n=1 Tax=Salarchaeum sp. JOR-1 TaxID=2599399 RepID=UPI001198493D|nr:multicopper oxidase family protein [Salarchaeum sp. JOR-1]QDX39383.1 multicopper oxidase family protein [Salarchaeum sp. JOR-1]
MPDDSRRGFLAGLTGVTLSALAGCARFAPGERDSLPRDIDPPAYTPPEPAPLPTPDRTRTLDARTVTASPEPSAVEHVWGYDDHYVGPELRAQEGEVVEVTLENRLPAGTTTHWHGLPLQNAYDGVPHVTQQPVPTGESFTYRFRAEPAGTYFYHSHAGLQLDRALLGPLVVEEPEPHVEYDRDFVVVFDDYLDRPPEPVSDTGGGGMGGMMGGDERPPYRGLLANGRLPSDPSTLDVREGERVRFRFVNAASATEFRTRLAGHHFSISHKDGRPVEPVAADEFVFGPGERYDAVVECVNPGAWQLRAAPVTGDETPARIAVRYDDEGETAQEPRWGSGRRLQYGALSSIESRPSGSPDRIYDLTLSRLRNSYTWLIDGQAYPNAEPLAVREGEHVRVRMTNRSPVTHPMHLHGHFFRVGDALMDTVRVPGHMGQVTFDFTADNPGNWLFHCHNLYHLESGMARVLRYT